MSSSRIVKQKLLVLKAASSILGCLGLFHHPEHMLFALAGFYSPVIGGISLALAAQSTAGMTSDARRSKFLSCLCPLFIVQDSLFCAPLSKTLEWVVSW